MAHTRTQLDGVVRDMFGDGVMKGLNRNNRMQFKRITIQLLTEKNIQLRKFDGWLLAALINPAKLDEVITCQDESAFSESIPVFPVPLYDAPETGVQEA